MSATIPFPVRTGIESQPGVCGGKPRIAGTRIRAQDVFVWHELQGQSADEIVSRFPQLTMSDVDAALSIEIKGTQPTLFGTTIDRG